MLSACGTSEAVVCLLEGHTALDWYSRRLQSLGPPKAGQGGGERGPFTFPSQPSGLLGKFC
jgi:hypothetical protein